MSTPDRLDSWKEIAAYLNRGVRTVRRWEREEGLPVHRHLHRVLGSVYAYKSEIDTWRRSAQRASAPRGVAAAPADDSERRDLKSIVVLPFTNLSANQDDEYFADALTDEVTTELSRIRALRVISRTSAMTFKRTAKDARTVARELRVGYILQGSARRDGERLRVTAQLIDTGTDSHLWSERYDGSLADVFAIQERLARTIVHALELRLSPDEDRRLADRPIGNVHAYQCYLQARQEAWRWRKDAIDHAIQLLENGLAVVGDNAKLYAALGHAYLQYREAGIDASDRPLEEAERCAAKLIALEPASASALQLRGWIDYGRCRIQNAVNDLKAALEIEPSNPDTLLLLINCYLISGRVPVARPLVERALAIDPLTPLTRCLPAFVDAMEGKFEEIVGPYRQMCDMDPSSPMARLFYVWALALNGDKEKVESVVEAFPRDVRDTVPARIASFLRHSLAGDLERAHAAVSDAPAGIATTDVFPRILAQGYAMSGVPDRAMDWLEVAVDKGFINYPYLAHHDPFFKGIRSDARFQKLMNVVRERWERFEI